MTAFTKVTIIKDGVIVKEEYRDERINVVGCHIIEYIKNMCFDMTSRTNVYSTSDYDIYTFINESGSFIIVRIDNIIEANHHLDDLCNYIVNL